MKARPKWDILLNRIMSTTQGVKLTSVSLKYQAPTSGSEEGAKAFDVDIAGTASSKQALVAFVRRLRKLKPDIVSATLLSSTNTDSDSGKASGVTFTIGLILQQPGSSGPLKDLLDSSGSAPASGGSS